MFKINFITENRSEKGQQAVPCGRMVISTSSQHAEMHRDATLVRQAAPGYSQYRHC